MNAGLVAALILLPAAPALADQLDCQFGDDLSLRFAIDRNQFAPAIDPGEPPRRKVTRVVANGTSFEAEPIVMDSGVRGFWTDDAVNGTQVLTISSTGKAIFTGKDGVIRAGRCKDIG
jgi:hypothetical protein